MVRGLLEMLCGCCLVQAQGRAPAPGVVDRSPRFPSQASSGSKQMPSPEGGSDEEEAERIDRMVPCLLKLDSALGAEIRSGTALRCLAAMARDATLGMGDRRFSYFVREIASLALDAGCSLWERAGLLSEAGGGDEGLCFALKFLSFRCFSAFELLREAVLGADESAVPFGGAVWRPILEASQAVTREGKSKLENLAVWWREREEATADGGGVAGIVEGGGDVHGPGGDAPDPPEALVSMRQQAEWLRGGAAGGLKCEAAAEHLESAADALEELHGLVVWGETINGGVFESVVGCDMDGSVVLKCSNAVSVYTVEGDTFRGAVGEEPRDVEVWAKRVAVGARALAQSIAALKRSEASRMAHGLPRLAQVPVSVALAHVCTGTGPEDPLGVRSSLSVQVQCKAGWPLSKFVEDAAWHSVDESVKQRVCAMVLGVCAVAEMCGVELGGVGVRSFVVEGVGSGSVGDLVDALDVGGCEVVLGACCGAWCEGGLDGCVSGVLEAVVGPEVAGTASGGWLAETVRIIQAGGPGSCMAAYACASATCGWDVAFMANVDAEANAWVMKQSRVPTDTVDAGDQNASFLAACEAGDVSKVRELLLLSGESMVNVHAGDLNGPEAGFRLACANGHIDVVRELLALTGNREVDVHAGPEGIPEHGFQAACEHGRMDVVRELLALSGHREVDVHAAFMGIPEHGFQAACENGHLDVVQDLLALSGHREVDVHVRHEAGFRCACRNGHVAVVRELLALRGERFVNVHAGPGNVPSNGFLVACAWGHVGVVRELLGLTGDREIDVHVGWNGIPEEAFQRACARGHVNVVRELLVLTGHREVDVHAAREGKPDYGFWIASVHGHLGVVRELLALTGPRAVPLRARQAAGSGARKAGRDAVWHETLLRRGRREVVLLRASLRR